MITDLSLFLGWSQHSAIALDSKGLVLVVREGGGKFWRYEFRLNDKKFKYGIGNYPEITLDNARKIHAVARQLVEFAKHPSTGCD